MDLSRKIIRLFLHHPMPPKAREMFRRWCLEEKDAEQKEALLHEEWNRLDPAEVLDIEKQNYGQKLRRLHAEMGLAPARRTFRARLLRMWPAAAAILVAGIVIADLYVVRHLAASRTTTTFVTAENCKGRITLPDNTVVWLNSESRLTYSKEFSRKGQRHVRLDGEAFFNVRKDSLRPFIVELGQMQVKVLGTSFNACNVEAFGTNEVTLLSGRVEILSDRLRAPLQLSPDGSCVYDTRSKQFTIKHVAASNYCNWLNDSIVFENTPLKDILTDLEHRYNIRFQVDPDVDTSIGLSFTLEADKLETTLDLTTTLANLRYRRINDRYIRIYH